MYHWHFSPLWHIARKVVWRKWMTFYDIKSNINSKTVFAKLQEQLISFAVELTFRFFFTSLSSMKMLCQYNGFLVLTFYHFVNKHWHSSTNLQHMEINLFPLPIQILTVLIENCPRRKDYINENTVWLFVNQLPTFLSFVYFFFSF